LASTLSTSPTGCGAPLRSTSSLGLRPSTPFRGTCLPRTAYERTPHPQEQEPRFRLGHIAATPQALERLAMCGVDPLDLLVRHVRGDWGTVPPEDAQENELSLRQDFRILSSYRLCDEADAGCDDHRVWIITEADRSSTTILRPEDY
jgi:hypothetical protein